jgi:hypothetical protein
MLEQCAHWFPTFLWPHQSKPIATLCHFHPLVKVDLLPFVNDFHLEMDLVLDRKTFISILPLFPHLSFGGPLGMVYELLRD